jgi:hypothetical protein
LCLAVLADGRLASGSGDSSIILWNPADSARLATLEGHTGSVQCLTTLHGNRLASGSDDTSIIIWNLADGKQLTKHEGHTAMVRCLATLDGETLASGGSDETIRVRPVLHSAAYRFTACSSAEYRAFEFEEVARSCRKEGCLGDLFEAAAVQQFDENIGGLSASASIARQAHVFDALAKVANEDAGFRSEMIDSLAPSVLQLVRDDALLPDMYRRGVSNAAIQELAPSPLFRVVLDAKFAAGPKFVLYFELFIFVVLGLCFTRVAPAQVFARGEKWFPSEKIVEIVVAFVTLSYFSVREMYQMAFTRAIELESSEEQLVDDAEGLASYLADAIVVPLHLVACCLGKRDEFEDWSEKAIREPIRYDALTFLGLSRAWRYDYWNWIDLATIGCAWAAFARAAMPGAHLSADLAVATSMLMWVRFCWYLKNMRLGWAKFVLMFEDIVWDCVEINQCVGCTRQFFTKSFLGEDAAVLARSSGEEPASPRHQAGVASMAWRTTR